MSTKRDLTRIRHNTKIVATLGPGSNNVELLEDMIRVGGLNVVRFNFSHGTAEFHQENARIVREAAKKAGREVAIMADLQGPKIRVGKLENGFVELLAGEKLLLDAAHEGEGNRDRVGLDYRDLPNDVKAGDILLLDDGLLTLVVDSVNGSEIHTTVQNSHKLKSNKGINKQGGGLSAGALTEKDFRDLKTAIGIGCDYLAVSFVKSAEDMQIARNLVEQEMQGSKAVRPGLVSKIERVEAITNLDEIILASDGIMVARGDLGVEIPAEDVPLIQKNIITKCNKAGKPVIVATQMLESMTANPRPTRAEASDVANAILDGTDAIMLSGETANGDYPVEAVQTMNKIAQRIESSLHYKKIFVNQGFAHLQNTTDAIAHATVQLAYELDASAIITPTETGYTTRVVSKYRPKAVIVAYAANERTARHLNLRWGVYAVKGQFWDNVNDMTNAATMAAQRYNYVKSGDVTIITSGITTGKGNTNSIRVYTMDLPVD